MKNCCGNPGCGRPFGLIRRSWCFEQFCSVKCRDSCAQRDKAYWRWLYRYPDSSLAADAGRLRTLGKRSTISARSRHSPHSVEAILDKMLSNCG